MPPRLGKEEVEAGLQRAAVDHRLEPTVGERRVGAAEGIARQFRDAVRRPRCISCKHAVAVQHQIAPGADRASPARLRTSPESAPIEMSSVIKAPSKPICLRIMLSITVLESVAGASIVDVQKHDVRRSSRAGPASPAAGTGVKSCASSSAIVASTCGTSWWLSTVARPWPGMCLMTGSTPPGEDVRRSARRPASRPSRRPCRVPGRRSQASRPRPGCRARAGNRR